MSDDRSLPDAWVTGIHPDEDAIDEQPDTNKPPLPSSLKGESREEQKSSLMQKDFVVAASFQTSSNHLNIDSDGFKIAVENPRLGMDRLLDSAVFHSKLNDLLERGLIPYASAREAFLNAQHNQTH
jgi:hypothetical protein